MQILNLHFAICILQFALLKLGALLLVSAPAFCAETGEARAPEPALAFKLLLAFASNRARPFFANVYFYEHDGIAQGHITGSIPGTDNSGDYHPALAAGGSICAYASKKGGGFPGLIQLWDVRASQALELPTVNEARVDQKDPALSGDGGLLVFGAWNRPGGAGSWDAFLFDLRARRLLDLPQLNTQGDEQELAISGNGRFLAFVSSRRGGNGLSDVYLYDRTARSLVPLPGLNSPYREISPSLSGDGRLLAFVSDRPGGRGGKDVYLYDRQTQALLPLPGLNSVAHEQTPALSPDGRFIAFVSERTSGAGERDIYLYDRQTCRLLPTPGLNSRQEDFDPSLTYLDKR